MPQVLVHNFEERQLPEGHCGGPSAMSMVNAILNPLLGTPYEDFPTTFYRTISPSAVPEGSTIGPSARIGPRAFRNTFALGNPAAFQTYPPAQK